MVFKCHFLAIPLSQEASGGSRGAGILSRLCEDCIPARPLEPPAKHFMAAGALREDTGESSFPSPSQLTGIFQASTDL